MSKVRSLGTTISISTKTIGGLTSIGGLELTAETIDTTSLDSVGGYREFIGGFKDGGEVTLEGGLDTSTDKNQKSVYEALESGAVVPCIITFPNNATWTFTGVVTKFSTSAELEDLIGFSASIKVSGKPVFAMTATPPV